MEYKDYYKTLGVPRKATDKEVKAAYRRLARKHHPDMNPDDRQAEARFKEINEAYEVLGDPDKRARYDELGADWGRFQGRTGGWPGARPGARVHVGGDPDLGGFSDFFQTFFGGMGGGGFEEVFRRPSPAPGRDLEHAVELSLEEVLRGTTRIVTVGQEGASRRVEVKIPAGVREGSRVRAAGEGGSGSAGGRRGDLYLRVRVAPDPRFERRGDDLHTTFSVPLSTAVLGGEAQVTTLEGELGIKVPAESPTGRVFRLRGHGLPRLEVGGGRGDVLAALQVELPRELSERERELFEELRRLGR